MILSRLVFLLLLVFLPIPDLEAQHHTRQVAVTFDDLPAVAAAHNDLTSWQALTEKLVHTIQAYDIPAIGFVNEGKLYRNGTLDADRVDLLRRWLDAGLELGNHSYSHYDLHRTPLAAFQEDVLRGEIVTRRLLAEIGDSLRYFRHPFLHSGRDLKTKHAFERFLDQHGYRVAPVTIDNSEWIFASAYAKAAARQDSLLMQRIADAYIPYMEAKFEYFEGQSEVLFGRSIRHVLLLHANALNADHFGALADMLKRRGYIFISLAQALQDKAFTSPDTYTGPGGLTWLHRWALTQEVDRSFFKGEPPTPPFVLEAAGLESE